MDPRTGTTRKFLRRSGKSPWMRHMIVLALCLVAVIVTQFALQDLLDQLPPLPEREPKDIPTYEEVMANGASEDEGVTVETGAPETSGAETEPKEEKPGPVASKDEG